jgi:hypothetical protein
MGSLSRFAAASPFQAAVEELPVCPFPSSQDFGTEHQQKFGRHGVYLSHEY